MRASHRCPNVRSARRWRRPKPVFSLEIAPPSVLAKARTERVERRTGEGGDLHDPAPADCPDIDATY